MNVVIAIEMLADKLRDNVSLTFVYEARAWKAHWGFHSAMGVTPDEAIHRLEEQLRDIQAEARGE